MAEKMVNLKLSQQKLMQLFRMGVLCAADIQCLDTEDRDVIQKLCLQTCSEKMCAKCDLCDQCAHQNTVSAKMPMIHSIQMH